MQETLQTGMSSWALVGLSATIATLLVWRFVRFGTRQSLPYWLKSVGAWGAVALIGVALYLFRFEFSGVYQRFMADIDPFRGYGVVNQESGSVTYRTADDNHVYAQVFVNNKPIRMLVDTGASFVVLSHEDARRVGFNPETMTFDQIVDTAGGKVGATRIKLSEIRLDETDAMVIRSVDAFVLEKNTPISLLGMSFLSRTGGFSFDERGLTIKP